METWLVSFICRTPSRKKGSVTTSTDPIYMGCLLIEEHLWWYTRPTFLSSACLANLVVLLKSARYQISYTYKDIHSATWFPPYFCRPLLSRNNAIRFFKFVQESAHTKLKLGFSIRPSLIPIQMYDTYTRTYIYIYIYIYIYTYIYTYTHTYIYIEHL